MDGTILIYISYETKFSSTQYMVNLVNNTRIKF